MARMSAVASYAGWVAADDSICRRTRCDGGK